MNWQLYSFVIRSSQRKRIVLLLKEPMTPTQISKELQLSTSHVSRTLTQFTQKKITRCLTPDEPIGKLYELTPEGKQIASKLNVEKK